MKVSYFATICCLSIAFLLANSSVKAEPAECSKNQLDGVLSCFLPNKSSLRNYHKAEIRETANRIKQAYLGGREIQKILIQGIGVRFTASDTVAHTSKQRAESVKAELNKQLQSIGFFIDADLIVTSGVEDSYPPYNMDTQDGRALNRRVVISISGDSREYNFAQILKKLDRVKTLISDKAKADRQPSLNCLLRKVQRNAKRDGVNKDCYVNAYTKLRTEVSLPAIPACHESLTHTVLRGAKKHRAKALFNRLSDKESMLFESIQGVKQRLVKMNINDGFFNPGDQAMLLNTQECSWGRFFLKQSERKSSPYHCFREDIKTSFANVCAIP